MYGINAGYDTRPMSTGNSDTGISVSGQRTAFYQQAAVNVEAVSDKWRFNAYALIPTGVTEQQLNSVYDGGALDTFGIDAGYNITSALRASISYYYQNGDLDSADGSGVLGRIAYAINNDLTLGANLSYDNAFDTRFSADIKWRFNANSGQGKQRLATTPVINSLAATPTNRDVRVHDRDCLESSPIPAWCAD
jgi:hypothetical protein